MNHIPLTDDIYENSLGNFTTVLRTKIYPVHPDQIVISSAGHLIPSETDDSFPEHMEFLSLYSGYSPFTCGPITVCGSG